MRRMSVAAVAAIMVCGMTIPASAEPLTIGKCLDVLGGLNGLDHYDKAVAGDKVVPAQYKLGALRGQISQTMGALQHVRSDADRTQMALLKEAIDANGGKPVQPGTAAFVNMAIAFQAFLDKPCDVTPARIKRQDLHIGDGSDENVIPPSVLSALDPILDDGK